MKEKQKKPILPPPINILFCSLFLLTIYVKELSIFANIDVLFSSKLRKHSWFIAFSVTQYSLHCLNKYLMILLLSSKMSKLRKNLCHNNSIHRWKIKCKLVEKIL